MIYFGWRYDFEDSKFERTEPIPEFLLELRQRAASFAGLGPGDLPHALVTEYTPGTEIGWHKDRPVFDDVVGVSLASPCSFLQTKEWLEMGPAHHYRRTTVHLSHARRIALGMGTQYSSRGDIRSPSEVCDPQCHGGG